MIQRLEGLLDAVTGGLGIGADGNGELDVLLLAESIQPVQESHGLIAVIVANDLGQAVNEDVGNIVVTGIHTADEALQSGIAVDVVLAGLNQTDLVADIKSQLAAALNTNDIAVLGLDGAVDHVDHLLGLTGALLTHDNLNHVYHSLTVLLGGHSSLACYHFTT